MPTRLIACSLAAVALVAGYAVHVFAQPRSDLMARPALLPISSSSSNGASFAWFYDHVAQKVVVCRIGPAAADALDCKAQTTLP